MPTAKRKRPTSPNITTLLTFLPLFATCAASLVGCSAAPSKNEVAGEQPASNTTPNVQQVQQGNLSLQGGTPTIREAYLPQVDNPSTTNDESNDQPVGHFGTTTLTICNMSNGNTYTLDADVNGSSVERIYFPKGGWVDFTDGTLDSSGNGSGTDEQGRNWEFQGFASGAVTEIAESEEVPIDDE